jgi:parallel beta-helix repeat protein
VRIENGFVNGCPGRAISIVRGGEHTIKKVTMRNNGYGLWVEGSTRNMFESVVAENNSVGADLTAHIGPDLTTIGSFDNELKAVKFQKNTVDGLQLDYDATDNEIKDSTVSENGRFGIYFAPRAARNEIYHNHIEKNGWVGLIPDAANVVHKNVIKDNGFTFDPAAWVRGGVVLFGSNNIVLDNDVNDNNVNGIAAGFSINNTVAIANTIKLNQADHNTGYNLADYPLGLCTDNDWRENNGRSLLYDGCENKGGVTADLHVVGAGKTATQMFEFNVKRHNSGAADGPVKVVNAPDMNGIPTVATVQGRASCLTVDATGKAATIGFIVEKSSHPALVPVYTTLHLYVYDELLLAGSLLADQFATGKLNERAAGDCTILPNAGVPALVKGKILVMVK